MEVKVLIKPSEGREIYLTLAEAKELCSRLSVLLSEPKVFPQWHYYNPYCWGGMTAYEGQ